VNSTLLEQAVRHLLAHHDSLRLRYVRQGSTWEQEVVAFDQRVPFSRIDLSTLPEAEQSPAIEARAGALQASLNICDGPLLQVALFDLGARRPNRLLITIHHLAVDGVSWRILLEDLQTAYEQLLRGEAVSFPAKTTSFKRWAERLVEYAKTPASQREVDYWLGQFSTRIPPLPVDYPGGANTYESAGTVSVALDSKETSALLQEVPAAHHTQINDVLLMALVNAFARWTRERVLLVDMEGHGREEIVEGVNLSRTVGWFTTLFPVLLSIENPADLNGTLQSVKEKLRRIPNRGIGYSILHYLSREARVRGRLAILPKPEVRFNYLGQFDQSLRECSPFSWATDLPGPINVLRGPRRHLIEVDGLVVRGRFQQIWTYNEELHQRSTIERLAYGYLEELRLVIAHCQSPEAGRLTPLDFPGARLNQMELDRFFEHLKSKGRATN
jgi:non-ribosomal peptide synthase protein (TIGR01720 family)